MIDADEHDEREPMRGALAGALERMREGLDSLRVHTRVDSVGRVVSVADGVAAVVGLERPVLGELLVIGSGIDARAEEVAAEQVRVVVLARGSVRAGDLVRRVGHVLHVPAGRGLLGRVVDPLGRPLDRRGGVAVRRTIRIERPPVPLEDRELVSRPLRTGIFALDTMIPIGRGQRQLLVGDRSTGKTELCIELLAALDEDTIGVYAAIGRRASETAATLEHLRRRGVFEHGFAVVSDADDPIGLIHLTPYAASAMAESLVESGRDVVIVYDDLTNHAHAHRSLALLLGRPVGREAHPVDVFHAHAHLLEQAAQLSEGRGGGSLTAIPIIETQAGDLTGYIPTNLVSITDGQIRLDHALAAAGLQPAIDVSLSVSRVGGRAQPSLIRKLAGSFKNRYAQFLELETFARFGTRLEASAQAVVDWGRRVRKVLRQERGELHSWAQTVARLLLVEEPGFERIPLERTSTLVEQAVARMLDTPRFDARGIDEGRVDAGAIDSLREVAREAASLVFAEPEGSQEVPPA